MYDTNQPGLMGYLVYQENQPIININDPKILSTELDVYLVTGQQNSFTITAYDNLGNESAPSATYIIDVPPEETTGNIPPVASIDISTVNGPAPLTVDVSANNSIDYDGTLISYNWNFGDGSVSVYENDNHTFEIPGTYIIILKVTDNSGSASTTQTTVTITDPEVLPNQPPVPLLYASPQSGPSPLNVLFDSTDSTDADGSIIDYSWDFGDGSSSNGIFVNYTYTAIGTFTGKLTVIDDGGASASAETMISVSAADPLNTPPQAVINASPLTGAAPLTTTFSAADSTDADGVILSYNWDFGDGSVTSGAEVSHPYSTAGTYTATLTVTDDMGDTGQAKVTISISEESSATTVIFTDDFSADTSSSYTNINGALSASNGAAHGADWLITFAHHNLSLGTSDHWVEADLAYNGLSSSAGLLARVDPVAQTGYSAYFSAGRINLNRFAGTAQTWIASVDGGYTNGTYAVRMVVNGSTIQIYVDGVLKIQKTDINYPQGLHAGLRIHRGSDNADVTADNLTAGIGTPPPFPQQNTPPVAQSTSFTTTEDTAVNGAFIVSDLNGDPLTSSIVNNGTLGNVVITNAQTGTYSYTPKKNVSGIDSFTYKANDGIADSNIATVNVTIIPVNDPPVTVNGTVATTEDKPTSGTLTATDIEGDALTYSIVTNGSLGTVLITSTSTGTFSYTPKANVWGTDTFTYKAYDGKAASNISTVTVTIAPVNDPPIATSGTVATNQDVPINGTLTATDIEGNTLSYTLVANGSLGTAIITNPNTGAFTYTPKANTWGTDSFTFKVSDGIADSNIGTVTVAINQVVSTSGVIDDFSSDTSTNYTAISGALTIADGKAHGQQWSETRVLHSTVFSSDDQFVEADVSYSGSVQGAGLLIRVDSSQNTGYLAYFEGGKLNLASFAGTSKQWLAQYNGLYTAGIYRLRIEAQGSMISLSVNGITVLTQEDAKYSSGRHVGLRFNQGSSTADMYLDNLKAGLLSAPPPEENTPSSIADSFSTDTSTNYTAISGTLTIADGKAHGQQWTETRVLHNTAFSSDDQFVEADVSYSGSVQGAGLLIRVEPSQGTGYLAYFEGGRLNLAAIAGTSKQWLAQYDGSYTAGTYRLRIEAQGSMISLSVNGITVLTQEDAKYSSGRHVGLRFNQGSSTADMYLDNLIAGIL
ncbi:MAG: tandem-95 repeat protein [Proteobacteria bacterium]|nr:tandem-95 repeat protein [Pseudomonadota bacterium]